MSHFETDGEARDPFEEEGESESAEVERQAEPPSTDPRSQSDAEAGSRPQTQSTEAADTASSPRFNSDPTPSLRGLTQTNTTPEPHVIAQALEDAEYEDESPPVPYAVWRDNILVSRTKRTLDMNPDLDVLVTEFTAEFNRKHDADVYKADVRELAMAYGLVHVDDLAKMMKQWGVQYDN